MICNKIFLYQKQIANLCFFSATYFRFCFAFLHFLFSFASQIIFFGKINRSKHFCETLSNPSPLSLFLSLSVSVVLIWEKAKFCFWTRDGDRTEPGGKGKIFILRHAPVILAFAVPLHTLWKNTHRGVEQDTRHYVTEA